MKTVDKKRFNWNLYVSLGLATVTLMFIISCIVLCNIIPKEIMTKYEIIDILIAGYSSMSLVLLVIQLIISAKNTRSHHDEKRREKTVDYMIKWSESLSWETSYAIKIVETFNHHQCISLYKNIPFEVDYKTKESLCPICSRYLKNTCKDCLGRKKQIKPVKNTHLKFKKSSTSIKRNQSKEKLYIIDVTQCAEIRWYVIKYLNHLEALLISWKEGIVDREIIEEQFYYLYNPTSGRDTLQSFRNVAGDGKSYPTIEEFCLELRNKRQQTTNKFKELL